MKTYEVIENQFASNIKVICEDGKEVLLPLDPANSDYAEYLLYLAWVEAGNEPDDFWTQDEGLI